MKGHIVIKDLFDDKRSAFQVANDDKIMAGASQIWIGRRAMKYGMNTSKDRKLANLEDDKFKVVWEPKVMAFKDGPKMLAAFRA